MPEAPDSSATSTMAAAGCRLQCWFNPGRLQPQTLLAFVVEQLDPLGPIASKRMFGGVGLHAGDLFLALIAADVLYL